MKLLKKLGSKTLNILLLSLIGTGLIGSAYIVWDENFSQNAYDKYIYDMYTRIANQSGQAQDILPFEIQEVDEINAYNDGYRIVMYRGFINSARNWDEIALVLGHEIAHGTLEHLGKLNTDDPYEIAVLEGNADKMGAVYAMKAGFDVCNGRRVFLEWLDRKGDFLNQDHPPYIWRFHQLNIQCGEF